MRLSIWAHTAVTLRPYLPAVAFAAHTVLACSLTRQCAEPRQRPEDHQHYG